MTATRKPSALDALREYGDDADLLANEDVRQVLAAYARQSPDALSAFEELHLLRRDESGELQLTNVSKRLALDLGLETGTALAMSGGGFRSMLFQAGVLWRMNEAGMLPRLSAISSVSGASITAGLLGLRWARLNFDARGVAAGFVDQVVTPLFGLASETIDVGAMVRTILGGGSEGFVRALQKRVFGAATLADLPDRPKITFCAADLTSGSPWFFSRDGVGMAGHLRQLPSARIAVAVAASLLIPPLGPMHLELPEGPVEEGWKEAALADGMLVDRFALEAVWARYRTILVSDGSPRPAQTSDGSGGHLQSFTRALQLLEAQGRRIWKRLLISSFERGDREGAYWGIETDLQSVGPDDPTALRVAEAQALAQLPTRYAKLESRVQQQLVNWGFVVADSMLRRHVDETLQRPPALPYPGAV